MQNSLVLWQNAMINKVPVICLLTNIRPEVTAESQWFELGEIVAHITSIFCLFVFWSLQFAEGSADLNTPKSWGDSDY